MDEGAWLEIMQKIIGTFPIIYKMAENVKTNKEHCQQIAQRVRSLEDLVLNIKQRRPRRISAVVHNALKELCITLYSAQTLMMKFNQTRGFVGLVKSISYKDKLKDVDKRLSDHLHILSGALLIEQGNMLNKVFETVSGEEREDDEYFSEEASSTTAIMPPPSTTPPMPMSIPTTSMPPPSTIPPMPMSIPTTSMTLPNIMHPMPMSIPTTSMTLPNIVPPMPMSFPTTPMPLYDMMHPMSMYGLTGGNMSPMPYLDSTSGLDELLSLYNLLSDF
ncbi:YLP motif-containing protein 1 [Larimichthys crocea]|uniref:YLP motif-containing protein 1 n=1 Tax=Larimichthys crocea TaxID=215358 RepID=UPI000F5F04DD|nr:YLP motif-containing protein 1 [Larimichthys crocea]